MKSRLRPILTALGVIVAAGAVRMPLEQSLTADFRKHRLLEEPLEIETKEKIGQNSLAIALAGVRTLVASFTALQVTEKFTKALWDEVDEHAETTVRLSPRSPYYWDIGAWHIGYNAASAYRSDHELPKLRAEAEARRWVERGREFFERGAKNNPQSWELWAALGNFCSNPAFFPDDAKAADAFARAEATGKAPESVKRFRLFAEARAGKEDPAKLLSEVREMLQTPRNRVPTMLGLYYALQAKVSPPADPVAAAVQIFGSEAKALRNLGEYFIYGSRMPEDGVETAVRLLESRAGVPPDVEASYIYRRERMQELAREKNGGR